MTAQPQRDPLEGLSKDLGSLEVGTTESGIEIRMRVSGTKHCPMFPILEMFGFFSKSNSRLFKQIVVVRLSYSS